MVRYIDEPMQTTFGDMWEYTSDAARADTAYLNTGIGPHNDTTYLTEQAG